MLYNKYNITVTVGVDCNVKTFGAYFKQHRIATGQTLRAFCMRNGLDPGNMSKLERGLLAPPETEEKLAEYARALRLKQGSADWFEFFDLAAAERGRLPADILADEQVLSKLPVLFRTLRAGKVDQAKLDALVERIRRT